MTAFPQDNGRPRGRGLSRPDALLSKARAGSIVPGSARIDAQEP